MITHNWIQINIYKPTLIKSTKPPVGNLLVTMGFMWHVSLRQQYSKQNCIYIIIYYHVAPLNSLSLVQPLLQTKWTNWFTSHIDAVEFDHQPHSQDRFCPCPALTLKIGNDQFQKEGAGFEPSNLETIVWHSLMISATAAGFFFLFFCLSFFLSSLSFLFSYSIFLISFFFLHTFLPHLTLTAPHMPFRELL